MLQSAIQKKSKKMVEKRHSISKLYANLGFPIVRQCCARLLHAPEVLCLFLFLYPARQLGIPNLRHLLRLQWVCIRKNSMPASGANILFGLQIFDSASNTIQQKLNGECNYDFIVRFCKFCRLPSSTFSSLPTSSASSSLPFITTA